MRYLDSTDLKVDLAYQNQSAFWDQNVGIEFYQKIITVSDDKILISGDIDEAPSIAVILKEMAEAIQKPI